MCPQALVDQWATPAADVQHLWPGPRPRCRPALAELHAGEPVTIGEALPNHGLLVIEVIERRHRGRPPVTFEMLPFGETGELCITGPGVAAGYLEGPELTAESSCPTLGAQRLRGAPVPHR